MWYPGGPERPVRKLPTVSPDFLHLTQSRTEIQLPEDLRAFMIAARKVTIASENPPIQVPGRLGHNRFEYHENGSPLYEVEFYDRPEVSSVFSGEEVIRTLGRDGQILVKYAFTGELTDSGLKIGKDIVGEKIRYFLREYANLVRSGKTFEVEHMDGGKWIYTNISNPGKRMWHDAEFLNYRGTRLFTQIGTGSIFLP